MSGTLHKIIIALLTLGSCLAVHAKIVRQFDHLSIEQGLSLSVVNTIAQDRDGYMWFGTQDGLNRYDGFSFEVYRSRAGDINSLPDNHITHLLADAKGGLWVGTTRGLAYRDHNGVISLVKFPQFERNTAPFISALTSQDKLLWIGTNVGLFKLDDNQTVAESVGLIERNKLAEGRQVLSLFNDSNKYLWVGNALGLRRFDLNSGDWRTVDAASGYHIREIFSFNDTTLLLGSESGLLKYDSTRDQLTHVASEAKICGAQQALSNSIQAITRDHNGQIWIGTPYGAVVFGESGECDWYQQDFNQTGALSRSDILTLFPDRDGVLWLGTFAGGVNKWNTRAGSWLHHLVANDALSSPVLSVLRDQQQNLWLGTSDKGLLRKRVDETEPTRVSLKLPQSDSEVDSVNVLLQDSNGDIWIGTQGTGLIKRDQHERLQHFASNKRDEHSLSGDFIIALHEDRDGLFWVGSDAGLDQLITDEKGRTTFIRYKNQLPEDFVQIDSEIHSIVEDWEGQLWLAGSAGLLHFDKQHSFEFYPLGDDESSPAASTIQSIVFSPDGDLWIASAEGVSRLRRRDNGTIYFERYYQQGALATIGVYSIAPGRDGELWLGSNAGMLRFDPNKRETLQIRTEQGLLSNEFNARAVFNGREGELIFGHITGAVSFDPRHVVLPKAPALVELVKWRIFDQPQPLPDHNQRINIDSDDRVLSFDFSLLEFTAPQLHRLRYRLHGLHDSWVVLEGTRTVVLSGLPANDYRLEVQLANAAGLWSEKAFNLAIRVNSPYWSLERRYWSAIIVLTTVALALIIFLIFRHRRVKFAAQLAEVKWQDQRLNLERRLREIVAERHQLEASIGDREREILDLSSQLDQQNRIDSLTGLPNRIALMSLFRSWQDEGSTSRFTLVLIDVDGLHFINERHGQHAGDQILVQVGSMLNRICRGNDLVYRLHADVFALVSAVKNDNEPALLAERIRATFLQKPFSLAHRRRADLTCSIGFSNWPVLENGADIMKPEQALTLADRALDLAKRNSRNAWIGLYGGEGLTAADLRGSWSQNLPQLIDDGKFNYKTSIPLAIDIEWYDTRVDV